MPSIYTYGSYAGIAVVGAGYYYLTRKAPAKPAKVAETVPAQAQKAKKKAKKATGVDVNQSGSDQADKPAAKKRAKKNKNKEAAPAAPAVTQNAQQSSHEDDSDEDEQIDVKEFARQMSNAKAGTQVGARPEQGSRQKSVKQSRASTNGFNTNDAQNSDNSGVADMLEAPSAGPSVLRVTAPANLQPKKEKKQSKSPESAETKKQRQNRQKKEAEQQARAEAESQRKVLEEQQRRTARLAEGRAAKDGSGFAAKAAAQAVWKGPEGPQAPSTNGHVQLLDTAESAAPAAPQPKADISQEYASLPSEEEQLRRLEEETEWATVSKPKKSKVKKTEEAPQDAPVKAAPVAKYQAVQGKPKAQDSSRNGFAVFGQETKLDKANLAVIDNTWPVSS